MPDQTVPLNQWTFNNRIVKNMTSKMFASAKSFLVVAGPRLFSQAISVDLLTPIGLVQQFSMQQQAALMRLFEVGSRDPYFVRGREQNRATLSRVMYDGHSLMRAMYINSGYDFNADLPQHAKPSPGANGDDPDVWLNLQSVVFEEPCGLYLRLESFSEAESSEGATGQAATGGTAIGGIYLEEVHIDSHQLSADANNVLIAENVGIQWARMIPVI